MIITLTHTIYKNTMNSRFQSYDDYEFTRNSATSTSNISESFLLGRKKFGENGDQEYIYKDYFKDSIYFYLLGSPAAFYEVFDEVDKRMVREFAIKDGRQMLDKDDIPMVDRKGKPIMQGIYRPSVTVEAAYLKSQKNGGDLSKLKPKTLHLIYIPKRKRSLIASISVGLCSKLNGVLKKATGGGDDDKIPSTLLRAKFVEAKMNKGTYYLDEFAAEDDPECLKDHPNNTDISDMFNPIDKKGEWIEGVNNFTIAVTQYMTTGHIEIARMDQGEPIKPNSTKGANGRIIHSF